MTARRFTIAAVLCLLALPAVAILAGAASHYYANRTTGSIVSSGRERDYILYVPKSYDPAKPTPLVISMHGAMNWPAAQMGISRWNRVADEHGFIVVYPAGEGAMLRIWAMRGSRTPSRMPDVVFISDLIDALAASYNIDPARIYANGLSNGGGMSFTLSCALSHRIAAVGLVGAAFTLPWEWCKDATPVPMVAFHGTGDRFTPYHGGKVWFAPSPFPSIPKITSNWARRNRCADTPVESPAATGVAKLEYGGCAQDASVVLYTIRDGGHTWPGGMRLPEWLLGPTSYGVDASRTMWEFFRQHPRR